MTNDAEWDEALFQILRDPNETRDLKRRLEEMRETIIESLRLLGLDEDEVILKADQVLLKTVNELKLVLAHHAEVMELRLEQRPDLFDDSASDNE